MAQEQTRESHSNVVPAAPTWGQPQGDGTGVGLPPITVGDWGTTAGRVAEALEEAILTGLVPAGTRLRELEIARQLGVSRTPVREALRQLAEHQMVQIDPNQGATVRPVSAEEILGMYVVRARLDGLAARLAAERVTSDLLARLESLQSEMAETAAAGDIHALLRHDLAFHAAIRHASNNRYLDRFLHVIECGVIRSGPTSYRFPGRVEQSAIEHERIVAAIKSGDADEADLAASEHVRHAAAARAHVLGVDVQEGAG